jgi:hypothetical protein
MKREVETDVVVVPAESGESTGSNAIWAITFIIVVGLIVGALYYSGILKRIANPAPQKVNVEVSAPAQAPAR